MINLITVNVCLMRSQLVSLSLCPIFSKPVSDQYGHFQRFFLQCGHFQCLFITIIASVCLIWFHRAIFFQIKLQLLSFWIRSQPESVLCDHSQYLFNAIIVSVKYADRERLSNIITDSGCQIQLHLVSILSHPASYINKATFYVIISQFMADTIIVRFCLIWLH